MSWHGAGDSLTILCLPGAHRAVDVGPLLPGGDRPRGHQAHGRGAGGDAADGGRRRQPHRRHGAVRRGAARQVRVRLDSNNWWHDHHPADGPLELQVMQLMPLAARLSQQHSLERFSLECAGHPRWRA